MSKPDRTYNPDDPEQVAEKSKNAKALDQRRLDGLRQLMSTANGRLWMWDFLSKCGLFSTVFNGNSKDYFNLGMRNAGMPTFADLQQHLLDEYLLMVKENANV